MGMETHKDGEESGFAKRMFLLHAHQYEILKGASSVN